MNSSSASAVATTEPATTAATTVDASSSTASSKAIFRFGAASAVPAEKDKNAAKANIKPVVVKTGEHMAISLTVVLTAALLLLFSYAKSRRNEG